MQTAIKKNWVQSMINIINEIRWLIFANAIKWRKSVYAQNHYLPMLERLE